MDLTQASEGFERDGFVVWPDYLTDPALDAAVADLPLLFPTAEEFHGGADPVRNARFRDDEFAGIDSFPFGGRGLNLLVVSDPLTDLTRALLGHDDLRLYSAEAWAKYTGAADYDQLLHRDYLNHTLLVPSRALGFRSVELFVFLSEVSVELGAPRLVPRSVETDTLPAKPNFFPRTDVADPFDDFTASRGRPELYNREVAATGGAGTVVAFDPATLHRGAAMTQPRGARFTLHLNFRPAAAEWIQRHGWADRSHEAAWYDVVPHLTPRQLELFGFPPPGHPFWTEATVTEVSQRYTGLDVGPWRVAMGRP